MGTEDNTTEETIKIGELTPNIFNWKEIYDVNLKNSLTGEYYYKEF